MPSSSLYASNIAPTNTAPTNTAPTAPGESLPSSAKASPGAAAPRLVKFSSLIDDVVQEASEAHEARLGGAPRHPVTGFSRLDERIGGSLPRAGTVVVLGNTGAGKTAFALQVAAQCAFPSLYVSTEMAPTELFRRQMARLSGTFLGRFKSGELSPAEVKAIAHKTAAALPDLCFIDATRAPANARFILDCAAIAQGDAAHLLVVIDSLHTWTRSNAGGAPEYEALGAALSSVQTLSHTLGAPILLICEQSRSAMDGGGVNSGAGNRFIEYGAELVMELQAAKETDATTGKTPVTLRLAKNRHGAAGAAVKFAFHGALQRFEEV